MDVTMDQTTTAMTKPKMDAFIVLLRLSWQRYRQTGATLVTIALVGYASSLFNQFFKAFFPGLIYSSLALAIDLIGLVVAVFASLAMLVTVTAPTPLSFRQAFTQVPTKRPWAVVGTGLLFFLAVVIGTVLLVIPGVYIAFAGLFAPILVYKENVVAWAAIQRSRQLTKGYWWAVFWRYLLLWVMLLLIVGFAAYIVGLVITPWATGDRPERIGELIGTIGSVLFYPLSLIFLTELYRNLVTIKKHR